MSTYTYAVLNGDGEKTGEMVDMRFGMEEDKPERITLDDGREAVYDYGATLSQNPMIRNQDRSNYIRCGGLGVDPDQVAEAKADMPFVDFCERTGDMLIPKNGSALAKLEERVGGEIR